MIFSRFLLALPLFFAMTLPAQAQEKAPAPAAVEAVEIEAIEIAPPPANGPAATTPDNVAPVTEESPAKEAAVEETPAKTDESAAPAAADETSAEEPVKDTADTTADDTAPETTADAEQADEQKAEDVRDVNYAALESAGILSSTRQGALGRSVWQNHKRSDIIKLMDELPVNTDMISTMALKKSVLLSQSDAGLIDNDIMPKPGHDLLTKRLYMLMDAGLYGDAYDLYTQSVEDPYHETLARAGILLKLFNADMGTTCLEEKVLSPRYKGDDFWEILDAACNLEMLGKGDMDVLKRSGTINAIMTQANYKVPAADHAGLMKLTRLERGMVLANGRLDYTALMQDVKRGTKAPSSILMMYVRDPALPAALLLPLQKEAIARGLLLPNVLKKSDPQYKRITEIENPAEKARALKAVLADEPVLAAIIPYADMIRENTNLALDPALNRKALSVLILSGGEIPPVFIEKMEQEAEARPENYVYIQALNLLGRLDKTVNIPVDKVTAGAEAIDVKKSAQILAIIENLDKGEKLNDNPARVYEKQLGLTSDGDYVMPSLGLIEWLHASATKQLTGSTVLLTLTILPGHPGSVYAGTLTEVVEGLQAVGLIESANKIMEEVLVSAMNDNKGE